LRVSQLRRGDDRRSQLLAARILARSISLPSSASRRMSTGFGPAMAACFWAPTLARWWSLPTQFEPVALIIVNAVWTCLSVHERVALAPRQADRATVEDELSGWVYQASCQLPDDGAIRRVQ
jgi:hypothetical protein